MLTRWYSVISKRSAPSSATSATAPATDSVGGGSAYRPSEVAPSGGNRRLRRMRS